MQIRSVLASKQNESIPNMINSQKQYMTSLKAKKAYAVSFEATKPTPKRTLCGENNHDLANIISRKNLKNEKKRATIILEPTM